MGLQRVRHDWATRTLTNDLLGFPDGTNGKKCAYYFRRGRFSP